MKRQKMQNNHVNVEYYINYIHKIELKIQRNFSYKSIHMQVP